jgi:hypothetical protein
VDLSAINVENLGTLLVPAPSKTLEELSAIAVIKEAIWLDNAQKVIERIKWSAISATKLVTLLRSAKVFIS